MSQELVQKVRDKLYPAFTPDKPINSREAAYDITIHVAYQLDKSYPDQEWGVITAVPGSDNNVFGITCGIVARHSGEHYDILINKFGAALASWQTQPNNPTIPNRWIKSPAVTDIFADDTEPVPPPDDDTDIKIILAKLHQDLEKLELEFRVGLSMLAQDLDVVEKDTAAILKKCQELLDKPISVTHPDYITKVFGQTITSKPKQE